MSKYLIGIKYTNGSSNTVELNKIVGFKNKRPTESEILGLKAEMCKHYGNNLVITFMQRLED